MMERIAEWSVRARFVVIAVAAALAVLALVRLADAPIDVFPEFAPPVVVVQTEAIGLSAEEVADLITLNLEELLSGVPWLDSIRSESVTGLSSIVMTFERGVDVLRARQMVQERLTLAYTLPNVAQAPVILQPLSATSRVMMVALTSETIDPTELSLLARWTIKPRLQGVRGVANVAIWGQRLRQLHVMIDPERLRDARVTQEDVIAAAGDALWVSPLSFLRGSAPGTGGWIDNRNQRLGITHTMPIDSPEDMAKVPLSATHLLLAGKSLTIGEVAEVSFAHPPIIGDAVLRDGGGLLLVIEKSPSANALEVTRELDLALAELRGGLPGVTIDAHVFRLASYIEEAAANLAFTLGAGLLLACAAIAAMLRRWRAVIIAATAIVVTLLVAALALLVSGATANTMVVAGLVVALAVVIDQGAGDAARLAVPCRSFAADAAPAVGSLVAGVRDAAGPAIWTTLIVVLALMPVFAMDGMAGAFFAPMAKSCLVAVAASLAVALAVTPAVSGALCRDAPDAGEDPAVRDQRADAVLRRLIDRPRAVAAAVALAIVAAAAVWPLLGQSLLPDLRERDVVVDWNTLPGTSHAETQRITARASDELRRLPGVRSVGAHVGRAVTGDQVVGINAGQIWIGIDPRADYDRTLASIRATIDGYPGIDRSMRFYLRDRIGEALTGNREAIVVRIYGLRADTLRAQAEAMRRSLAGIGGIVDARAPSEVDEPRLELKVDLDAAGRVNVKPGDVRRSAATVFSGLVVGYLFRDQKIFEVVVWGAPEARRSLTNLRELWIEKSDRSRTRLGDVAEVSVVRAPAVIRHARNALYVDVVADVAGRDVGAVAREVESRLRDMSFPLEHHAELLGEYQERERAQRRVVGVAAAATLGIFVLLHACLGGFVIAGIAMLSLPVAAAGALLGAALGGATISLGSIAGLLAVVGIATRHAVAVLAGCRRLERGGMVPPEPELVVAAVRGARPPLLAGAAAIVAAVLPMVVAGNLPGLEILRPIAVVILGATLASAAFALFAVPPLYVAVRRMMAHRPDRGTPETAP